MHGQPRVADDPPPDVMLAARAAMAGEVRASLGLDVSTEFPGLVAMGHWSGTTVWIYGWILIAIAITGVAMFAWTIPGVVRDDRRHRRALALLRDHCCGWCGYDVRGLAEGMPVCPECGKALVETRDA